MVRFLQKTDMHTEFGSIYENQLVSVLQLIINFFYRLSPLFLTVTYQLSLFLILGNKSCDYVNRSVRLVNQWLDPRNRPPHWFESQSGYDNYDFGYMGNYVIDL